MAANDKILLDAIIEKRKAEQASALDDATYFEIFTAENILKQEALTYEELESGIVGSGGDGGLDAIYFLADGRLVREDTDPDDFKKRPTFEAFFVQAKRSDSFGESALDKFISVTENLFDLSKPTSQFSKLYNGDVLSAFDSFRKLYIALAGKHPGLKARYVYATKGLTADIHTNVEARVDELRAALLRHFPDADFHFAFAGAAELLQLARKRPPETLTLPVAEVLASSTGGYVALAKLSDFNKFLRNEEGKPYGHIFDENVRAYQGTVEVNKGIRDTLETPKDEDFWWLNNGVTILARQASQTGKSIQISDPQIINGLQTSSELIGFFDEHGAADQRQLLVKIVQSESASTRDRVIKATNSQTSVQPASLRATDTIQRNIEEALLKAGIYYDRQKNFYKNEGRPLSRIIGIAEMAQTVMATLLQRPNDARARPSSLIKDDADYERLFSDKLPIGIYVAAGELKKRTDDALRTINELPSGDRNNVLYYVLTRLACRLTKKQAPTADDIAAILPIQITGAEILAAYEDVWKLYVELGADEKVAKGRDLVGKVKALPIDEAVMAWATIGATAPSAPQSCRSAAAGVRAS